MLKQKKFWSVVSELGRLEQKLQVKDLANKFGLSETELSHYLGFMQKAGFKFEIKQGVVFPQTQQKILNLQLDLMDWLQGNQTVKIEDIESESQELLNLAQQFQVSDSLDPFQEILKFLEESIIEKQPVSIGKNDGELEYFPLKMMFFEGCLNLIGEDLSQKKLGFIPLNQIERVYESPEKISCAFSSSEIEEYAESLKARHEKVIRLVLKINSHENFSIKLNQLYFHNPCLFMTPQGDYIWAATLEPNPVVFEWLCELGAYVEILDPTAFKREFLKYCEDKLKKIA